ncbi:antitoxin VapB [Tistlia consotensis]|uniref:Antitoxin VapB n=1 Tax=Tistlia consotensis USBA 355 TaxID=560819 RepID=A0A1Y6BUP7_9PROT|nr:type II toxin-antitoxin system VapB family antitoxin [Tistlia consotensis]SMF22197.1 antitoxin VapB [Tistlia consotensis USBA 355]SNR46203.1 antitoxin VapB [Tistlia consotensis]
MALNIKSDEADRLARELARRRGLPITRVVIDALQAELNREKQRPSQPGLAEHLMAIGAACAALPDLDSRSDEEILGYDEMIAGSRR